MKRLLDHLRANKKPAILHLDELPCIEGLSPAGVQGVTKLAGDLKGMKASASPWDMATTSSSTAPISSAGWLRAQGIGDRMRAIAVWQFLNFLRDQSPWRTGSPVQTLLDRVRNLVLLAEERDLRQVPDAALQMNAVRLMTVHGSKGLEFEAVQIQAS